MKRKKIKRMSRRRSYKSYIDIKISGTLEVYAETREEAVEKAKELILEQIYTKHPSFLKTGLPDIWEEWLNMEVEMMLGIEAEEVGEDEEVEEEIDVRWTNKPGQPLSKGGKIRI